MSTLSTEVLQAINRARCRRVIDEHGRCAATHVYLRLPDHDLQISSEELLQELQNAMPGVQVEPWAIDTSARLKGSMRAAGPALLGFASGMRAGEQVWSPDIRRSLGLPKTESWWRLIRDLKNPESRLSRDLLDLGVVYRTIPRGRRLIGALFRKAH